MQDPQKPPATPDDWDSHWREVKEGMLINPAYRYRLRRVDALLDLPTQGNVRFIDLGCGDGSFAARIAERRPDIAIAGIDASEVGVAVASASMPGGRFFALDMLAPTFEPPSELRAWATHALCSEVLEHLDDPVLFLDRARQFLAPGGILVLTVPAGPQSAFDRHLGHRRHYTRRLLTQQLQEAGWRAERVDRAGFPFHNLYRLAVVAAGGLAVNQARGQSSAATQGLSRLLMGLFDIVFRLNLPATAWGWQLVARAHRMR